MPDVDCLAANRMPHRYRVQVGAPPPADAAPGPDDAVPTKSPRIDSPRNHSAPSDEPAAIDVVASLENLPFASESIDLIVLAHQLEFSTDPHRVLRECERVLRPEGRLIVTGFNPHSLWGLRHSLGDGLFAPHVRGSSRFLAVQRLCDWMRLLNLDVEAPRYGCYAPALRTASSIGRTRWLDRAGDRWWPILGSTYLLPAVKRVHAMRLQGPVWRVAPAGTAPGVAAPVVPAGAPARVRVGNALAGATGARSNSLQDVCAAAVRPLRDR